MPIKRKRSGRAVARVNGVAYVVDMRLRILRSVEDPDDVVDFGDDYGEACDR